MPIEIRGPRAHVPTRGTPPAGAKAPAPAGPDTFTRAEPRASTPLPKAAPAAKTSPIAARGIALARDEAIDRTGRVRPHYAAMWPLARDMSKRRMERALRQSRAAFRGDNKLHPVPRILTASEVESLKKGVTQRGTALRMFLEDHYSGKKSYTAVIPKDVVDKIIVRNREHTYEGLIDPKNISFPYGPDIMRAPDGKFYVIEDNTGFIGGPGDLLEARETLFEISPELRGVLKPIDDPKTYYASLVSRAKERAIPHGARVVMYQVPPYADHEDDRLRKIMEDNGVTVVTPHSKSRLVTTKDGVFVESPGKKRERVGFVFLNGEHKWIDASHPSTRGAFLLGHAEDWLSDETLGKKARALLEPAMVPDAKTGKVDLVRLEKVMREIELLDDGTLREASTARGLMQAMFDGKVATNYSPGLDFVGDKAFKGYVDDLVRFYLGEEPALESIPVTRFSRRTKEGLEKVDEEKLKALFDGEEYRKHVFKVVDGRGGKGVYIGPKMKAGDVAEVKQKIRAEPGRYVAEPFMSLSTLAGHIVDLRMISTVDPKGVVVSPTPWGRGVPLDGDGKVNLSQKGKEFAVVVVADPKPARAPTRPRGIRPRAPRAATRTAKG